LLVQVKATEHTTAIPRIKLSAVVWHLIVRMRPFRQVMAPNLKLSAALSC
jgi:hypothetical protein